MRNLNIIILAHNEAEYVKLSIQSIRMFADIDNLFVVLVDNNSTDGLQEWATEQTDITYVLNAEEGMPYGKIVNEVWDMLELKGDLLLLDPHFMLTPSCLSRMITTLYEEEHIGAVGPISNGLRKYQKADEIADYEQAISLANQNAALLSKQVMALSAEAILLKENTFVQLGGFDEDVQNSTYTIRDYCFRMIQNDKTLKVCKTALLWDSRNTVSPTLQNSHDEKLLEDKWGMHYFNSSDNPHLINMIQHKPTDIINILEIGCDCGGTLLEIKNQFPLANVYGSELNEKAAQIAAHFATVTVNNIEDANLPYESNMFDYIIFGDVLEHLHDPYKTIQYCRSLLRNNGCIIASIPNLMHISVIGDLLNGNFTYTETGLLDKTHIHFFTFNEIIKTFQTCGYEVMRIVPVIFEITKQQDKLIDTLTSINETPRFMYETFQYVVCAKII